MTDSQEVTEDPVTSLRRQIGTTLKQYFDVRRQRAELKLDHEKKQRKLTEKYEKKDAPLGTLEAELAATLRALVIPNELVLITGRLRSFAARYGNVSFKKKAVSTKIVDPAGFERQARKDRLLTKLGKFVRTWKPDSKAAIAWLQANPVPATKYEPFLERDGGYDELFVRPNEPYLTEFDPNQLTVKAVNLGRTDNSQDESPDA